MIALITKKPDILQDLSDYIKKVTSLASGLSVGLDLSSFRTKSWASFDKKVGNSNLHFFIFLKRSLSFIPLKGNFPVKRTNRRIPNAQMSAFYPQYSIHETISGAIYPGVPQKIFSFFTGFMQILNPKSIIFMTFF